MKTKRTSKIQKIKTYCPVFNGFYDTIHESVLDNAIYDFISDSNEEGETHLEYNDLVIDNKKYQTDYSKEFVEEVGKALKEKGFIKNIVFEEVASPRFYNFSNDSINVEVELNKTNINNIREYIKKHIDGFEFYIEEQYTSCDGFTSFFSNDADVWIKEYTEGLTNFENDCMHIGTILDFICLTEEIMNQSIASELFEKMSGYDYISVKEEVS
jgi:hypothetical protein